MDIAVEAKGLCKNFPSHQGQPAVCDLNLAIPRGQLYGLVGPDGAGKTTTLRMLSTVIEQSSGSASVAGYDISRNVEKVRQHIGYMPQNFSLYPDLSVIENLNFFADINHVPGDKKARRIDEMLSFTRLTHFQSRRAGKLSGGMKKKLVLACALIHEPEILLLDEPSTGVDPVSRRELWLILSDIVQHGITIVVSTPYMDEAERCHQVGMLFNGRLLISGTPAELEASLPFTIVETKAKPRKEMRRIVSETKGILEWRAVGDRLRLAVPNGDGHAQKVAQALNAQFKREGLDVRILRQTRPSMEDVFTHLVEEQRGTA
jgi:ABC-2 type transport system ATP-binding protein